jgi:hypothetical protein
MLPSVAAADVLVHLASYHVGRRAELAANGNLNEFNPGIGYSVGKTEAGYYLNTEGRGSAYVKRDVLDVAPGLSAFAGVATGYRYGPVVPIVGLTYRTGAVVLNLVPGVTESGYVVPTLTASIKVR